MDFPELVSIGANSFQTVPLTSVNFLKLVSIGNNAFQACGSLETATLPALKSIGDYGFRGCANLESLNMPSLETIGNMAFYGCTSLAEITLGETPPPTVGTTIFSSTGGTTSNKKQITLKVPAAKTGDYETWKSANNSKFSPTTVELTIAGI